MEQRAHDVEADVLADDRVAGARGYLPGLIGALTRRGLAWLVRGDHAADDAGATFRAWLPVWQVLLAALLVGGVVAAAIDEGWARTLGVAVAAVAAGALAVAVVLAAGVASTRPPPRRPAARAGSPFHPHDAPTPLLPVADGVHVAQRPLTAHGFRFGARMTVLDTGAGLLVHSPVAADEALLDAVRALGVVRWIVAPNVLHHLFVRGWADAFPEAEVWAAPGLAARRPDLPWTGTVGTPEDAPWPREVVDVAVFRGHPFHEEVALLHRPSGTLVLADMLENLGHDPAAVTRAQRLLLRLALMDQRPTAPTDWKATVTDLGALRASVARIEAWRFSRIVLSHGPMVEEDAEVVFREAFAFVR